MKKKIIIPIIVSILVVLCVIGFILYNNKVVSIITLDINPSMEIGLGRNNKIVTMKALNEDAKEVMPSVYKGKNLETVIARLTLNVIDKGYTEEGQVTILVYSDNGDTNKVTNLLKENFGQQDVHTEVIVVDSITEEDKELASKYNISPAKASYINSITKESNNITFEDLIEKPVNELEETKEYGWYCDSGWILDGSSCIKETERQAASTGLICPEGYFEEKGKCYKEVPGEETGNLICAEGRTLEGDKCIFERVLQATPVKYTCSKGEQKTRGELGIQNREGTDSNDLVCVDLSKATHPVSPCEANDGTEYTRANGKCYWHRAPVINTGCPGKVQVNGECWDDATGIYICPGYRDGRQYKSRDEWCENSIKMTEPTVSEYKCEEGTLRDDKCIIKEEESSQRELACPSGYTKVEPDRCIDFNNVVDKVEGLVCEEENSRLKGNTCVFYERIEAKQK